MRCCDPITKNLYSTDEKGTLPQNAVLASLGCGNPTALIDLKPAKPSSISALAEESTSSSPQNASGQPAKLTAWI